MARLTYPRAGEPRPAALPPAERTVGQLVAESIRLYGDRFFASVVLGVPAAVIVGLGSWLSGWVQVALVLAVGGILCSAALVFAVLIVHPRHTSPRALTAALATGLIVFVPALVSRLTVFPGIYLVAIVWMAATIFAVPALLVEGVGPLQAFRRSFRLARADIVHAVGGLATFIIAIVLTSLVLTFLLRGFSDQSLRAAAMLALLVVTPLFFIGSALLYVDQSARVK